MSFKVEIHRKAEKELKSLSEKDQTRVLDKLFTLGDDPFPPGSVKLKGHTGYRLRSGDYRILYEVDKKSRLIIIYAIGHRKEVYR